MATKHFCKQKEDKLIIYNDKFAFTLVIWDILPTIPKRCDLQFSLWKMLLQCWLTPLSLKITFHFLQLFYLGYLKIILYCKFIFCSLLTFYSQKRYTVWCWRNKTIFVDKQNFFPSLSTISPKWMIIFPS